MRAGDRGNPAAIDAVWRSWLRHPDDERWEPLSRWRGSRPAAEAACEAALAALPNRMLADFCAARGLAPADPVRRAVFLMLTRQFGQHRAADPDGSLLALGYAAASDAEREHLRAAMAESGDLDLVRVVSVRQETARTLTPAEREYMTAQLSRRRDWPGLWRLALGFPIAETIAAVQRIEERWRPDDQHGHDLFGRLRGAAPADPVPTDEKLSAVRIELPDRYIHGGSFSPDGRRLAAVVSQPPFLGPPRLRSVCEIELPHGTVVAQYVFAAAQPDWVLHLGGVIVAIALNGDARGVYRLVGGRQERLSYGGGEIMGPVPYAGGFAVLWDEGPDDGYRIACYDDGAQQVADVRLAEIPPNDPYFWRSATFAAAPGTDPGQLVIRTTRGTWVYEPFAERFGFRVRYPRYAPRLYAGGSLFTESGWLLTWDRRQLLACRLKKGSPGHEQLRYYSHELGEDGERIVDVAHFPRQGKLAILTAESSGKPGTLLYYADARTLDRIGWAGGLSGQTGWRLLAAPDGTHGILSEGTAAITFARHPLTALIGQPLSTTTPADLSAVKGALGYPDLFPAMRPVLELLAACLEYRFGAEVALGNSAPAPEADDIGLSARDGP